MAPSGIDKEKLLIQIDRVEEYILDLESIKPKWEKEKGSRLYFSAIQRMLQIVIQECLNVGTHIIAGFGLKRADTYKDVFKRLRENKIISENVSRQMEGLAVFRNRLVHLYWEVTPEDIRQKMNELDVFRKFVKEISIAVEKRTRNK